MIVNCYTCSQMHRLLMLLAFCKFSPQWYIELRESSRNVSSNVDTYEWNTHRATIPLMVIEFLLFCLIWFFN